MQTLKAQELVRELITETDHLSRAWHGAEHYRRAGRLEALRTRLQRIERSLGSGDFARFALSGELDVVYQRLHAMVAEVGDEPGREAITRLMEHADHLRHQGAELVGAGVRHRTVARAEVPFRIDPSWAVPLAVTAAVALATPWIVPGLRRSPIAWGLSAAVALTALGSIALSKRTRDRWELFGRDALATLSAGDETPRAG